MATIEKRQQISYTNQFLQLLNKSGTQVKPHTWKNKDGTPNMVNQRIFAQYLGEKLGYRKMEDWYDINVPEIKIHGGIAILRLYDESPSKFVIAIFPKYNWIEWKFENIRKGLWSDENNHKKYALWLEKKMEYTKKDDWYNITKKDFQNNKGGGLLKIYNTSPSKFVMIMFPKHNWIQWKFKHVRHYWSDENHRRKYALWLEKKMGYTKKDDWYSITKDDIEKNGGSRCLSYYKGSPRRFVMNVFPKYNWDISKFKKNYSRGQIQWLEFLKVSTPDIRHILNHPDGEFYIPGSREFVGGCGYHADGFSEIELMIYEYLGDFYHGNPALYKPDDWCKWLKTTYGALYNNELKRRKFCEDSGFGYHSIWESEWHHGIRAIVQLQRKFKNRIMVQ